MDRDLDHKALSEATRIALGEQSELPVLQNGSTTTGLYKRSASCTTSAIDGVPLLGAEICFLGELKSRSIQMLEVSSSIYALSSCSQPLGKTKALFRRQREFFCLGILSPACTLSQRCELTIESPKHLCEASSYEAKSRLPRCPRSLPACSPCRHVRG